MKTIDVYTAVVFQTDTVAVQSRAEIRKNLDRILEFCERIPAYSTSAKPPNSPLRRRRMDTSFNPLAAENQSHIFDELVKR